MMLEIGRSCPLTLGGRLRWRETPAPFSRYFGVPVGGAETSGAVALSAGVAGVVQSCGLALQSKTIVGAADGAD